MNDQNLIHEIEQLKRDMADLKASRGFRAFMKKAFMKTHVIVGIVLAALITSFVIYAGTVIKLYTFVDGTTISAGEVNGNFDTLFTLVNGNLDNDNISDSANIAQSKIEGGPFANLNHTHGSMVWSTGSTHTDYFTVSTSWTTMPDLTTNPLTITTSGNPIRFGYRGNLDCDGTYCSFYLKITVDGVACGNVDETTGFGRIHTTENNDIYQGYHVEGICSADAGEHTVQVWYRMAYTSSATCQLRHHSDLGHFLFWVEEIN